MWYTKQPKKSFCCLSTSALVRGWFNNDSSLHWERSTRQCAHICRDNLRLACVQTPTSSQKQFEGYMRSNNLRLACVQTPTSVEIRPLKLKSRSFGEIFGNFNVVSLFVPRLEEAILTQLLIKFSEDPQFLDRNVTGTPRNIQKWATKWVTIKRDRCGHTRNWSDNLQLL